MRYPIEFCLALIFEIQALVISILIFVFFIRNPTARVKRHHHSLLFLLGLNFIQLVFDLPTALRFYDQGFVLLQVNGFCAWWVWFSFSLDTAALFICVWISIERHLIIFHHQFTLQNQWVKWLLHFPPLIICCIWSSMAYMGLVVISPYCTNVWNFETLLCGPPCYTYVGFLGIYDFVFNVCVPLVLVILINFILIVRVIKGRLSRQPAIDWRRHRKMILQFWAVSTLHIALWAPLVLASLVQITTDPTFMADQYTTLEYILYYMPLLLPLTCLTGMPELTQKIKKFFHRRSVGVAPLTNQLGHGQTTANT